MSAQRPPSSPVPGSGERPERWTVARPEVEAMQVSAEAARTIAAWCNGWATDDLRWSELMRCYRYPDDYVDDEGRDLGGAMFHSQMSPSPGAVMLSIGVVVPVGDWVLHRDGRFVWHQDADFRKVFVPAPAASPVDEPRRAAVSAVSRPGGWVPGIGWVALYGDLTRHDRYVKSTTMPGWYVVGFEQGSPPSGTTPVIARSWADGMIPEPPAATPCPYVVTSGEGTSHCALAESRPAPAALADALGAEVAIPVASVAEGAALHAARLDPVQVPRAAWDAFVQRHRHWGGLGLGQHGECADCALVEAVGDSDGSTGR